VKVLRSSDFWGVLMVVAGSLLLLEALGAGRGLYPILRDLGPGRRPRPHG
jgi:hypothetical protein